MGRSNQALETEMKLVCRYCHHPFEPSPFHPEQTVCTSPDCQRQRRTDYHRNKAATDPDYRQVCSESRRKWRDSNPDYQAGYRGRNQAYVEQNRKKQRHRNEKRKLSLIVKNNLAIDVKGLAAEVWMTGPGLDVIVKNNLAIQKVFVFQTLVQSERTPLR